MVELMGSPKLKGVLGKRHVITLPVTVREFLAGIHPQVYVFICAHSAGVYCGRVMDVPEAVMWIDPYYHKRAYVLHMNKISELRRTEKIGEDHVASELEKTNIRLDEISQNQKNGVYTKKDSAEHEKLMQYKKRLLAYPERLKALREYAASHPVPDYPPPILDLHVRSYYSRHLPDEPPMWMIETDSEENGDVWLLSEMPEMMRTYRLRAKVMKVHKPRGKILEH